MMSKGFKIWAIIMAFFIFGLAILTRTNILTNNGFALSNIDNEKLESVVDEVENGRRVLVVDRMDRSSFNHLIDVLFDSPNLFWLDLEYHALSLGDFSILFLKEKYEDLELKQKEIDRVVEAMLDEIISDDMSEYDKVLAVHNWLCESIDYKEGKNDSDQDIYGAFILKEARCAGYAKAFTYALDKIGIKSEVISGDSINKQGDSVAHAWNVVYIDGEPYYFDITWNDEFNGKITYDWFGVTSAEFKNTHFPNNGYDWIISESNDGCYYRRNGMYMESYSAKFIAQQIRKQGKEFSIKCSSRKVLNETIRAFTTSDELQKIMRETGITFIDRIVYEEVKGSTCLHVKII